MGMLKHNWDKTKIEEKKLIENADIDAEIFDSSKVSQICFCKNVS